MIKMKVSTYYEGKRYNERETYKLNEEIERRWTDNGIAELVVESNFVSGNKSELTDFNSKKSSITRKKSNIPSE